MWLKNVIKELFTKINNLTTQVYQAQLKLSKNVHHIEYIEIINKVKEKVEHNIKNKKKTIKQKIKKLLNNKKSNRTTNEVETHHTTTHKFYQRIENHTNIKFTEKENTLLEKGFKYGIHPTNNIKEHHSHLLNVENSILKTKQNDQDELRTLIITELNNLPRIQHKKETNRSKEAKTIKEIKHKLQLNNATIKKADKGNTLVIMNIEEYKDKIKEYIENNEIAKLDGDPTLENNHKIKQIISTSKNILSDQMIRINKAIRPTAPQITGLPKIHKQNCPIRPLINFTTAPTYKIARTVNAILKQYIKTEDNYSITNNIDLVNKIESITIPHNATLASFDITNMYTNIPINETIEITKNLLIKNNVKTIEITEIIKLITEITSQNYFTHNKEFFKQTKGLPMGSPLSGTLAEIYLNHLETEYIINEKNRYRNNIIYWYRYVDDIIMLFRGTKRQLDKLHLYINNIHPNIKFTLETETNNKINFLDLTIKNNNTKHAFKIYRKPTETDHTIHSESHHPYQHKISAYNHMINRLNNIQMTEEDYTEELINIKHIAKKNGYSTTLIDKINQKHKTKIQQQLMTTLTYNKKDSTNKYISVEYNHKTSKIIQKAFKKVGYTVAYRNNNKMNRRLKNNRDGQLTETGVYKLTCNDCNKFYIGQTGRAFSIRYKEHISDINRINPKSNFAQHIKTENHNYTNIDTNLIILHRVRKGQTLNRLEEIEIYKNKNNSNILNDKINTKTNKIYELIIRNGSSQN